MKMTLRKPEFEGEFYDAEGWLHTDTGDTWHADMPRELWTPEARELFLAAKEAGLIQPHPYTEGWLAGEGVTKSQLAYWCKKASTYLKLDKGKMQKTNEGRTNWKVFEAVFNYGRSPLRLCLHDIGERTAPEDAMAAIDQFYSDIEAAQNPQK